MEIARIVAEQRKYFYTGSTLSLEFRLKALRRLSESITRHEPDLLDALKADLNKSSAEAYLTEIDLLQGDLRHILRGLPGWMKNRGVRSPLVFFPARCYQAPEPYGVALIMSPWNYPFMLTMEPLVGALAAGNCAVVKPSAYAPKTSAAIATIIADCFPPEYCTVVEGGRSANAELLNQKFDTIFFTGSVAVGKTVMEAAAKYLTPVTLELGGKSPVIVDDTADIQMTARKLAFGKFINAGQTCVAPDYVLAPAGRRDELVKALAYWIDQFYPADGPGGAIADYPRIVNQRHFERLSGLMQGEQAAYGGMLWPEQLTIAPTVLTGITFDSPVMQEEIFGPILPILTYDRADEMLRDLRARPKPLALYLFSNDRAFQKRVMREISFGGGCINDTILHVATPYLPFGGVEESGMGSYHGKASFDTFTHYKGIVDKATWIDFPFRYRPYNETKLRIIRGLGK